MWGPDCGFARRHAPHRFEATSRIGAFRDGPNAGDSSIGETPKAATRVVVRDMYVYACDSHETNNIPSAEMEIAYVAGERGDFGRVCNRFTEFVAGEPDETFDFRGNHLGWVLILSVADGNLKNLDIRSKIP